MSIFIIAELSANHNGSLETAKETIRAMKASGVDAVKLQTYTPDTITLDCDSEHFQIKQGTVWDGRGLYELYAEAMTPWEWHKELFSLARSLGMEVFSSPFDKSAVDFLEELCPCAYKIASFEITDTPLIEYAAKKGRPMIISTGVAELADIELAVQSCKKVGNDDITLLKCTSSYPTPLEEMNISTIADMKSRFGCKVGLSDHSMSIAAPVAAVTLGAQVIEKHFILDRKMGGADSSFSLEPNEFADMVKAVRDTEKLIGKVSYELSEKGKKSREFARSIFVADDIMAGEVFEEGNVRSVRPGFGLHPKYLSEIIGKRATRNLAKGEPLEWGMIE
ncbi:MAG: pseudaminic acid synthase [Campylobacterales bacterium]|nr:pseudaminic acid synthase [Campylobacterales bacterium]